MSFPYSIQLKRSNGDNREISLTVSSASDTVQTILSRLWVHLREQGLEEETSQVRMIYAGKLLSPPSALLSSFNIVPDAFVHFIVSDAQRHESRPNRGAQGLLRNVGAFFFNTQGVPGNEVQSVETELERPTAPSGGLDVLQLTHRLTSDEVQSLRAIFHDDILRFAQSTGSVSSDSGNSRQAETAWLVHQDAGSEFMANLPRRTAPRPTGNPGPGAGRMQQGQRTRSRLLARLRQTGTADYSPDSAPLSDNGEGVEVDNDEETIAAPGQTGFGGRSLLGMLFSGRNQSYAPLNNSDVEAGVTNNGSNDGDIREPSMEAERHHTRNMSLVNLSSSSEMAGTMQGIDELGSSRDWIWGFMLGFSFGTLMLLCAFERNMNYRNKLGIITGIMVQLVMANVLRSGEEMTV